MVPAREQEDRQAQRQNAHAEQILKPGQAAPDFTLKATPNESATGDEMVHHQAIDFVMKEGVIYRTREHARCSQAS